MVSEAKKASNRRWRERHPEHLQQYYRQYEQQRPKRRGRYRPDTQREYYKLYRRNARAREHDRTETP